MEKFKVGDRVRNLLNTEIVPAQTPGTIICLIDGYLEVRFDNGVTIGRLNDQIELLTESSSPTPEMGPVEGTMEYWRFLFAGQAMQGILSSGVYAIDDNGKYISNPKETSGRCVDAVQWADALIAELKKGGKS